MNTKMILIFMTTLSLFGTQAMADLVCTASTLAGNQSSLRSSMQMPKGGAVLSTFDLNGYKITVDCDLYHRPNQLMLKIVGPQSTMTSTSTDMELKLVDGTGVGVSVNCVAQ